jgi:ATP-dependent Clp protease ATP-binding subunit ClpC
VILAAQRQAGDARAHRRRVTLDRFTPRARWVVPEAEAAARGLGDDFIGTQHLLLGLLADRGSIAAGALRAVDVTLARVRDELDRVRPPRNRQRPGSLPLTPRARRVLGSIRTSRHYGHRQVGPEHILLALVDEDDGVALRVLDQLGARAGRIIEAVERAANPPAAGVAQRMRRLARIEPGPDVQSLVSMAAAYSPGDGREATQIGLPRALPDDPVAAAWLRARGVDVDAMRALLERGAE